MADINSKKNWEPVDFTVYLKFIQWPLIILIIAEIFLHLAFNALSLGDKNDWLDWMLRLVIFAVIGYQAFKHFGGSLVVAAIAGGLGGLVAGLVISLYRFVEGVHLWKFFNVITETTLATLFGALVVAAVVFLFRLKNN